MDIVIPYRKTNSDELKYTLRSLVNLPHDKVYIIGDKTPFNVNHIQYIQGINIAQNTLNIMNIAANHQEISEDFIYMHDDMFILNPIKEIPIRHRGTLKEVIGNRTKANFYVRRMIDTMKYLQSIGIEEPLCYDIHIPFVINKEKWRNLNLNVKYNKQSTYGNVYGIGGTKTSDVKVRGYDSVPKDDFVSSYDPTFKQNALGKIIREKFKNKCEYEF